MANKRRRPSDGLLKMVGIRTRLKMVGRQSLAGTKSRQTQQKKDRNRNTSSEACQGDPISGSDFGMREARILDSLDQL
jgi:hypothetical protein